MEVTRSHTFTAPADAVIAMLGDREAIHERYEGMGHRDVEVIECERAADSLRVRTSRVVDVELPGFAKKVLKPTNTLVQRDEWHARPDGGWDGTFDVDVQGSPIHLEGTMRLLPEGDSCTEEITVDVTAKVPLIGGRIADWAAKNDVSRSVEAEYALGDRWLAAHRD